MCSVITREVNALNKEIETIITKIQERQDYF
jgi:hypothetical protein